MRGAGYGTNNARSAGLELEQQELIIPSVPQSDWQGFRASRSAPCSLRLVLVRLLVDPSCSCFFQGVGLPVAHSASSDDLDATAMLDSAWFVHEKNTYQTG